MPNSPDQLPESTHYYRSDEGAPKKTLLRLFGFDGRASSKLGDHSHAVNDETEVEDFEDDD
jgi:hypothetical protein